MIKIQSPPIRVYLYGRPQDEIHTDEYKESHLVIYIDPTIFTKPSPPSLEGLFAQDQNGDEADLEKFSPLIYLGKANMKDFEQRYHGRFHPFKERE